MVILTGRLVDAIHVDWPYEMVFCDRQAIRMPINLAGSSEDDLREEKPQPMAFPIFGRGRALYALVGKGINNDTIDAAGADLTGPCTCTIKEQNPGIDMMGVRLNWKI